MTRATRVKEYPFSVVQASMARRVNREAVVLLGWGRAILFQVAHPLVAAGVAEHSDFRGGALNYVRRTRHTVRAMLGLTFGSAEEIQARADRINTIHTRVHGILREPTVHFPAGHTLLGDRPGAAAMGPRDSRGEPAAHLPAVRRCTHTR